MSRKEQLKSEIDAMEAVINPAGEPAANNQEPATPTQDEPTQTAAEPVATSEPIESTIPPVEEPKPTKPRVNWKKRFTNLKASQDATIFELRRDDARKSEEILDLRKKLDDISVKLNNALSTTQDTFSGVITDEEVEVLGPEAVEVMKKLNKAATEREVEPLKQKLKENKEQLEKEARDKLAKDKAAIQRDFLTRLGDLVPDFAEIDKDKRFLTYMDQFDPASGQKRARLFKIAEHTGDVGRVAEFFLEFKGTQKKVVNQTLEDSITPVSNVATGNAAQTNDNADEPISMAYIDEFYNELFKGGKKWKGREKEKQAELARIDRAVSVGNLVP